MPYAFPGQAIITSGGRRVVAGGGAALAKTYADFQAHIATLATNGIAAWGGTQAAAGKFRTIASPSGALTLNGSSWTSCFFSGGNAARIVQHGLPSEAEYNRQTTNSLEIYINNVSAGSRVDFPGRARNGYTSTSYNDGTSYQSLEMTELIYWDGTQAQRMQPSLGLGPTPYTW